jgi:hypothetical protein
MPVHQGEHPRQYPPLSRYRSRLLIPTMTNPTPNEIRDLARAALALRKERDILEAETRLGCGPAARRAWWAKQRDYERAIKDPAVGLALCDRLELFLEEEWPKEDVEYHMNKPLDPVGDDQ